MRYGGNDMKHIDITTFTMQAMRNACANMPPDATVGLPFLAFNCPIARMVRAMYVQDGVHVAFVQGRIVHVWFYDGTSQRCPLPTWAILIAEMSDVISDGQPITAGMLLEMFDRIDQLKGVKVA